MVSAATPPRYDDSVVNLLRLESEKTPVVRASLYRNLIDLMMQDRPSTRGATRTRIFETLSRLHPHIPVIVRKDVARRVGLQRIPQPLDMVLWLWTGDPEVTPEMLETLNLRPADWLALLPKLPKSALGQLSSRADLPPTVQRALTSLGAGGLEIQAPAPAIADAPASLVPIETLPKSEPFTKPKRETSIEVSMMSVTPVETTTTLSDPSRDLSVDWTQLRKPRPEDENHLDSVARSIFVRVPEQVFASNDDLPSKNASVEETMPARVEWQTKAVAAEEKNKAITEALSEEAQAQIRDLIQRIADFRKRWIDKPITNAEMNYPLRDTQLSEIANVIHSEMEIAGFHVESTIETPQPEIKAAPIVDESNIFEPSMMDEIIDISQEQVLPENQTEADEDALMLTEAIAHRLPPLAFSVPVDDAEDKAEIPLAATAHLRSLAQRAASLADWQWETDRVGNFLYAHTPHMQATQLGGLLPALRDTNLISLLKEGKPRDTVTRALDRRSAFRDIEFEHNDGPLKGHWWLSGVAVFDPRTGLYLGHRGVARKSDTEIVATTDSYVALKGTSEILSTLAHETRTPLNAIMGFAQMIDAQTWGAVPAPYAPQASAILQESQKLLQALDDVTDAHRLQRGAFGLTIAPIEPGTIIMQILSTHQVKANAKNLPLLSRIYPGLPMLWSDREALERALGRLLVIAISQTETGESVIASVRALQNDAVCFSIGRIAMALDDDASAAPALPATASPATGNSFAMRFVQQVVISLGGRLETHERRFDLIVPATLPADSALPKQHKHNLN
jgi:His Kinase A (phospho-acceptor) domain